MVAAAGDDFPSADTSPAGADEGRQRHWSREVYFVKSPDLSNEVRRAMKHARRTWDEIHTQLWHQERHGRTPEIRAAARDGVLLDVGIRGIARGLDVHHTTVSRHLEILGEVGTVAVLRVDDTIIERDKDTGRITKSSGREDRVIIKVTVGPEHLRPFGAQRDRGRGVLSARSAPQYRKGSLQEPLSETPPTRKPASAAGSRSAEAKQQKPRPPAPVVLVIDEQQPDGRAVRLRCPCCRRPFVMEGDDIRTVAGLVTAPCACGQAIRYPGIDDIDAVLTAMTTEAGLTAGGGRGSMEGGPPVVIAGGAVSVSPSSRGPEPEPEPEPEPSSQGRARNVASDARCPSTVPDAGGAADRAAAGTPEGDTASVDDDVAMLEAIVREKRQRDEDELAPLVRLVDELRQRDGVTVTESLCGRVA